MAKDIVETALQSINDNNDQVNGKETESKELFCRYKVKLES